jgi:hypothetical protein
MTLRIARFPRAENCKEKQQTKLGEPLGIVVRAELLAHHVLNRVLRPQRDARFELLSLGLLMLLAAEDQPDVFD